MKSLLFLIVSSFIIVGCSPTTRKSTFKVPTEMKCGKIKRYHHSPCVGWY